MVLTALDDNLRADAADVTDKEDTTLSKSVEENEKATELSIVVSSDDEEDSDDDEEAPRKAAAKPPRPAPQRTKKQPSQQQQAARRRRRRSSARFLRLTGRFEEEDDDEEQQPEEEEQQQEHLGEMYKRAIRMNAENRINAGNSWGLRLIENIDKFLVDDEQDTSGVRTSSQEEAPTEKRVNFTKASCTLDASVKIYSYRVDDVHLTSYKVLANLNRTETGKKQNRGADDDEGDAVEEGDETRTNKKSKSSERRGTTETLESNVANLNMSKLDSAFDIDPLFHKMSKTFDEGGAKGLLLVNLGVGANGCNIVFDSKEEATSIAQQDEEEKNDSQDNNTRKEGMMDISSLTTKLESLLNGESIESIPLVPQLRSVRQEYEELEQEGFVDHNLPKSKSRRYATSQEEEKEAEMSIHQEALERSRASQGTLAQHAMSDAGGDSYAADDFGGGDDDDDDDDFGFSDFIAADENGGRYSSISFQDEAFVDDGAPPGSTNAKTNTTALLDAICSGDALGGNDYEFFNAATVEKLTTGNVWAGSAHWKKTEKLRKKRAAPKKKITKTSKKKKDIKKRGFVDLSKPPCLDDVLRTAPKSKRGTDPLQLSKAIKTKYGKADNLLPPDAGIGIEQLSTLFLRPNTVLGKVDGDNDARGKAKTVGFQDNVESFGMGFDYGGDDDSFGGDDDGPGFAFADSGEDEFVIGELEGVRKVDKIKVGYATVAKKVDVKRLKKDLWNELEATFAPPPPTVQEDEDDSMDDDTEMKAPKTPAAVQEPKVLSFKDTVTDMEAKQPQGDVTLPFYFICLLHLANEKGLRLESTGLEDFVIRSEDGAAPLLGTLPNEKAVAEQREKRAKKKVLIVESSSDEEDSSDSELEEDDEETDSDSE